MTNQDQKEQQPKFTKRGFLSYMLYDQNISLTKATILFKNLSIFKNIKKNLSGAVVSYNFTCKKKEFQIVFLFFPIPSIQVQPLEALSDLAIIEKEMDKFITSVVK